MNKSFKNKNPQLYTWGIQMENFFLAMPHNCVDLSPLTRDQTLAYGSESSQS